MASSKLETLIEDTRAVSFSHVERLYLQRAIDVLAKQLESSAKKEMSPDVQQFREKELDQLRDMRKRLGA